MRRKLQGLKSIKPKRTHYQFCQIHDPDLKMHGRYYAMETETMDFEQIFPLCNSSESLDRFFIYISTTSDYG